MASVQTITKGAQVQSARAIGELMKTNVGPRGTLKMLVSGAGDVRLTKDGTVLLNQMPFNNPTIALISRTATAQDDITGDGTTSTVLLISELMRQAERFVSDGMHPRVIADGIEEAKVEVIKFLEKFAAKYERDTTDRDLLLSVAKSTLGTKLGDHIVDQFAEMVTDAVLCIREEGKPIDLHMVEVMHMLHQEDTDSRLVQGLVLDHGSRHPNMKKRVENAYILIANISLEYEKTEVNSSFYYDSAEQKEKLVKAERAFTDRKVEKIIALKNEVCGDSDRGFVILNQKGIDPISLDQLQKAGIVALRRAKRRNMERLMLACGGSQANSVEGLSKDVLGYAGLVYEHVLGEDKYTFVEKVKNPRSCTILVKGPNGHTISQLKEAVRDGLRAVKNAIEDKCVIPGGGAFEVAAHVELMKYRDSIRGRTKLGVECLAQALLIIPKTLIENSGFDALEKMLELESEYRLQGHVVGVDVETGEPMDPVAQGVWDTYRVKRNLLHSACVSAGQLLLVDEFLKAGKQTTKQGPE